MPRQSPSWAPVVQVLIGIVVFFGGTAAHASIASRTSEALASHTDGGQGLEAAITEILDAYPRHPEFVTRQILAAAAGANDEQMSQVHFGRFLEERAPDVVDPDAATVVEVCMNLDAIKKVAFKSAVRLSDGFRQLEYVESNGDARGAVRVPEVMTILVPVFEGMEPERIKVRLRYRMNEGALIMWVTIDNADDIERLAFEWCIEALAVDQPDLPIYRAIL